MRDAPALHDGFVLHRRPYRETSALLEILTPDHGRIGAVARGARARRGDGALQPFQATLFGWRGRGELLTLVSWEVRERARGLQGHGLVSGLYLNELLVRLLPRNDPQPELHAVYTATLDTLADADRREAALRRFERCLLAAIGYGLELQCDTSGAPLRAEMRYRYAPESGPQPVQDGDASPDLVSGATLLALGRDAPLDITQLREAKHLMRALLQHQLGGRPILSRGLLRGA